MKNILLILVILCYAGHADAQVPNANFEVWDSSAGYKVPVGWDSPDSLCYLVGSSYLTCERGAPGYSGAYYLKLTSKMVPGFGVAAGLAMTGKLDFTTYLPRLGFAFTTRPASLNGVWQYAPAVSTDTGVVSLGLTKWNTATHKRDTVGAAYYKLPGSVTSWAPFSVPITYVRDEYPDTAIIYFSASGPTTAAAGSYLYIDTVLFSGSVPLGMNTSGKDDVALSVYPNPNRGSFTVSILSGLQQQVHIVLTDVVGNIVKQEYVSTNTVASILLHTAPGLYFLQVTTQAGIYTQKVVIQ